jgi:hypothetical protein
MAAAAAILTVPEQTDALALTFRPSIPQSRAFGVLWSTKQREYRNANKEEDEILDDVSLLKAVEKSQLVEFCEQMQLSTQGTKQELLERLRDHANAQAEVDRQRQLERAERVQEGTENSKERYEIVGDDDLDGDSDEAANGFFYFELPKSATVTAASQSGKDTDGEDGPQVTGEVKKATPFIPNTAVTAPPPPPEPNANGERVVTVYNSADQNDLTGIAAAQPGQAALQDSLNSPSGDTGSQPWDLQNSESKASSKQIENAKEEITELVQVLLSMTGAPAFVGAFGEDLAERLPSFSPPESFVGFQPGKVPTDMLTKSSKALRAGRGEVLQDVLRQFELQAIGQDGMGGDDPEKGGGYYREVSKVRAFLEGYRRAEVRRLARETSALLLDKLVAEGVEGLDISLASMTRTSDDTGDYGGELNDSLLEYLTDAIRQQQQKVDQLLATKLDLQWSESEALEQEDTKLDDRLDSLWNSTIEDGYRVESLDPKDPMVKRVLIEEYEKSASSTIAQSGRRIPSSPSEQLLLLLTLLRERIKAEAAFAPDEKGRNLRLLAYCLRLSSDTEREQLILKDLGNSLDRLDSFMELVASSIEYGESTSHQLHPAKSKPLNTNLLKSILNLSKGLRERQSRKASGV